MEGCQRCAHGFRVELRVSSAHGFSVFGLSGWGPRIKNKSVPRRRAAGSEDLGSRLFIES